MLIPILPVPVMKNVIRYSPILAPLLLRKFAGQPRRNTGKHLFPDRVIFNHIFFCCKNIDDINTEQEGFTGGIPLGELTDILKLYDEMYFWILLTEPDKLLGPLITINKVDIVFSINGTKRGEFHSTSPISQDYSQALRELIPGKSMYLKPNITLTGKPVDVLKFNL